MVGRGWQQEGKRQGDRGQKEEPVKAPKEGRNMTLLRNWKARRPEGLEHKVCIFLFVYLFVCFQIAVVRGKELGTNKG